MVVVVVVMMVVVVGGGHLHKLCTKRGDQKWDLRQDCVAVSAPFMACHIVGWLAPCTGTAGHQDMHLCGPDWGSCEHALTLGDTVGSKGGPPEDVSGMSSLPTDGCPCLWCGCPSAASPWAAAASSRAFSCCSWMTVRECSTSLATSLRTCARARARVCVCVCARAHACVDHRPIAKLLCAQ